MRCGRRRRAWIACLGMTTHRQFAQALRSGEPLVGYWSMLDSPVSNERIARLGYDYVCLDMQHGLIGYAGMVANLTAIDAGSTSVGLVRVEANDFTMIGRALDAGAVGVIVPMVDDAADATAAVAACRYPPLGRRSHYPARAGLRIGFDPADAHAAVAVIAMIETAQGLANVESIAATPGLDAIYIGPSDLRLAVGGATTSDPSVEGDFQAALARVRAAGAAAGIRVGIHTPSGAIAAARLAQGYSFVSVASDLTHLEAAAGDHLAVVRDARADG